MSWSRKGSRLKPTSCQAWSTTTTMRRRGVQTLEILHEDAPGRISGGREASVASHGRDGIGTLEPSRPRKPRHVPLDKVRLPLREFGWSEPVPTGIASATIHSRGRDSCSGLVFACSTVLDGGLTWCPWCPLTSEFGSMGLKQATQANRLNLRKASKYAGFQ